MAISAVDRLVLSQRIDREFAGHLDGAYEYMVLRFVYDRTTAWGKSKERILVSHITKGIPGTTGGVPISNRKARSVLLQLVAIGLLVREEGRWGHTYSINYEWTPVKMLKIPRKKRIESGTLCLPPRHTVPTPLAHRAYIKKGTKEEGNLEQRTSGQARLESVIADAQKRTAESAKRKAIRARGKITPGALAATWSAAMVESFPGVPAMVWTKKMYGICKPLLKEQFGDADVHEWIAWVIANWQPIKRANFMWLTKKGEGGYPTVPRLQFIVGHRRAFLDAWGERKEIERRQKMTSKELTVEHYTKKGMSEEQAVAKWDAHQKKRSGNRSPNPKSDKLSVKPLPKNNLVSLQPVAISKDEPDNIQPLDGGAYER